MTKDISDSSGNEGRSDSIDYEEEMPIMPLELEDICFKNENEENKTRNLVSRGRFEKRKGDQSQRFKPPVVEKWRIASRAVLQTRDPWQQFGIVEWCPEEECIRHRYSAYLQEWAVDHVRVKMQNESFGRGAMRECYRLKKLAGNLEQHQDNNIGDNWSKAHNYVAKRYLNDVDRKIYFADVQLQADGKLWSEEYNRHNPPKKIDIIQVSILEFLNRPDRPLYHLEHFIEGEYIKYNSNSGFVSDQARQTPQAFSHFTFERSGHRLMVVDIQGVGDLYTDPQIHSADGKCCYGDGDLGTRGMALFFYSHQCNDICQRMALTPFDLSTNELTMLKEGPRKMLSLSDSRTSCRNSSVEMCESPVFTGAARAMDFLRQRSVSKTESNCEDDSIQDENECVNFVLETVDENVSPLSARNVQFRGVLSNSDSRETVMSSAQSTSFELDSDQWKEKMNKLRKPSCILADVELLNKWREEQKRQMVFMEKSDVLGNMHLDMVRYYEIGRFTETSQDSSDCVIESDSTSTSGNRGMNDCREYDKASAWFHLEMAAKCGILEAVTTMARIYLGLPHDLLKDFVVQSNENSMDIEDNQSELDKGVDLMEEAAYLGDKAAMLFMAEAYETGRNLGSEREICWMKSIEWYEKIISTSELDENDVEESELEKEGEKSGSDVPTYKILAKISEMYNKGGPRLSPDPMKAGNLYSKAADEATEAMQGKLASKFYMLAEEAWAMAEEE